MDHLLIEVAVGELSVKRRLRVAFFSTGDELASIGAPLKTGEVYDSNRYTLHGMLQGLGVEIVDLGVVRDALLHLAGRADEALPLLQVKSSVSLRKVPGRTEFQRGIVFRENDEWKVRTTGQQGSGVLRSMSEANCFIVLEHGRGNVQAGEGVSVQLFEGLA